MKPIPWSHSSLDDFVNCPRAYYEKRIAKSVKEEQSEQMVYGNYVHKAFELRVAVNKPLPQDLASHETFMVSLIEAPGEKYAERRVGLNRQLEPCAFFAKDVWTRGVVDKVRIDGQTAHLVDYKTGKPHNKFKQLKLSALYTFAEFPQVQSVNTRYYWTKTETTTGENYHRSQVNVLWNEFVPDLKQYAQAFKTDTWQPRPSGLCNGWCPVKDCDFWRPKRER